MKKRPAAINKNRETDPALNDLPFPWQTITFNGITNVLNEAIAELF